MRRDEPNFAKIFVRYLRACWRVRAFQTLVTARQSKKYLSLVIG